MTAIPLRPMSVGEILDRSLQVYRRHFATMFVVALLGSAPISIVSLLLAKPPDPRDPAGTMMRMFTLLAVMYVVIMLVWGCITAMMDSSVHGDEPNVGDGLRRGLRAVVPLLVASIWVVVLTVIAFIPFGILMVAVTVGARAGRGTGAGSLLAVGLMSIAMVVVAGLLWAALTFLLTPVVVLERKGPFAAVGRTFRLGKGARLRLLGVALVAFCIVMMPGLALSVLPYVVPALKAGGAPGTVSAVGQTLLLVAQVTVGALTTPFTVGCMLMAYYDRRVRLEGLDVELASAALQPEPVA